MDDEKFLKTPLYHYRSEDIRLDIFCELKNGLTEDEINFIRSKSNEIIHHTLSSMIKRDPKEIIKAQNEKKEILHLFGNRSIFIEEIPNGYCSSYCCQHLPWFLITTSKGIIKVGWRKRVINIDWSASTIKEKAEILFPNENTTKENHYIHAWGYEKAQRYIDILLS